MKQGFYIAALVLAAVIAFLCVNAGWYWFEIHLGIARGGPDPYYNAWSGALSDLGELALLGGLITLVRHVNCHEHGCWRMSGHVTPKGYRLCKVHIKKPIADLNVHEIHADHL